MYVLMTLIKTMYPPTIILKVLLFENKSGAFSSLKVTYVATQCVAFRLYILIQLLQYRARIVIMDLRLKQILIYISNISINFRKYIHWRDQQKIIVNTLLQAEKN